MSDVAASSEPFPNSPTVSVVVATNGRLEALRALLAALEVQRFRPFELCVVEGPSQDGTAAFLGELADAGRIKHLRCLDRNVSMARNLGVAAAAGTLIAFIDDDALPEPDWLARLVRRFADPRVAAAGGMVLGPDGRDVQFRYSLCDRFGIAEHGLDAPADEAAFPFAARFPHVMGTNAMVRRSALVALGGFDEEYEYYLDEADLCCRLVDAGHTVVQEAAAIVRHGFLAGTVRDEAGVAVRHFPILKNQIYFSFLNGRGHAAIEEILHRSAEFQAEHRADIARHCREGRASPRAPHAFEAAAEEAWQTGLTRGLSGKRRCRDADAFADPPPFLPYPDASGLSHCTKSSSAHFIAKDACAGLFYT